MDESLTYEVLCVQCLLKAAKLYVIAFYLDKIFVHVFCVIFSWNWRVLASVDVCIHVLFVVLLSLCVCKIMSVDSVLYFFKFGLEESYAISLVTAFAFRAVALLFVCKAIRCCVY